MPLIAAIRNWAKRFRRDVVAVYFAARDPETPWPIRLLALAVAAYALSPVDLIPDFVPVLGYLDDLLIVPLGIALVIRLLPPGVLESARAKSAGLAKRPRSRVAAGVIIGLWLFCAGLMIYWMF